MANEHALAVRAADRTTEEIKHLFNKLGNSDAPRGKVLSAYREARKALKDRLDHTSLARDSLHHLRATVIDELERRLDDAVSLGDQLGKQQLEIYDLQLSGAQLITSEAAVQAVTSALDAQLNAIYAMIATGASDEDEILGDESRVGLLSPGPVVREGNKWITTLAMAAMGYVLQSAIPRGGRARRGFKWYRQAVAAIDHKTTETCLLVHGQIQPMGKPFRLTGTPRFADTVMDSPFHWSCRTAEALVRAEDIEDDVTEKMLDVAKVRLEAFEMEQLMMRGRREQTARVIRELRRERGG